MFIGGFSVKLTMKYIILYVNDLEATVHFYKDMLGLPIKMQQGSYVEFNTGAIFSRKANRMGKGEWQ